MTTPVGQAPTRERSPQPHGASLAFAFATRAAPLQRSPSGSAPGEAPPIVHEVLRTPGAPLDRGIRNLMEARLGSDLSDVRVHTDERAAASARAVNALAYTVGTSIVFDRGRYAPHQADGRGLLAHELVHTIQQSGGVSSPPAQRLSVDSPDSTAEGEARVAFASATRTAPLQRLNEPEPEVGPEAPARPLTTRLLSRVRPAVQRSPVSDELAKTWDSEDKAAFFDELRQITGPDEHLLAWIDNTLTSDDHWLAQNLFFYGPESGWPIHLRVDREMRGWEDSGGKEAAFEILRAANTTEKGNVELSAILVEVFPPADLMLARLLQEHGPESRWPDEVRRRAVASTMGSMVGQQATWTQSEGQAGRPGAKTATTFAQWAEAEREADAPTLSASTTINCWEVILLAAYNTGLLSWQAIQNVYVRSFSDADDWFTFLARRLIPRDRKRYLREQRWPPLDAGQIVLFDGVGHVALATGSRDELGHDLVYSFWPVGADAKRGTLAEVEMTTLDKLAERLDESDYRCQVYYGNPPW